MLDSYARDLARGSDREAARRADATREAESTASDVRTYLETIEPFTRSREGLVVGTTDVPSRGAVPVGIPWRIAHGLSAWIVGATGAGKTTALAAWTYLELMLDVVMIALCNKGDYAQALTEAVLPALAMHLPPARGAALLAKLRVIAPWVNRRLPSLHLTAAVGNVARRAVALTELFVAAVAVGEFGHRQLAVVTPTIKLLMKTGVPFALFPDVLLSPGFRRALLLSANDPELSQYFDDRFPADCREGVLYSILSRFDRFLSDDVTKLALFGPKPFDVSEWLESGTTICDLSGGLDSHRRFWASLMQHEVITKTLSRRTTRLSPRVVLRIDEVQMGIPGPDQARELDEALSLMRAKRACMWIAHQHAGQLAEYPTLLQSLRTNVGTQIAFRVAKETAAATACVLPELLPPGMGGQGLSESEIQKVWERVLTSLPNRTFLLRVPLLGPSSIPVRTFDFNLDSLARGVPEDIRVLAREGQEGYPRAELVAREDTWRRVVVELAGVVEPNSTALAELASPGPTTNTARPPRRRRSSTEVGS